MNRASPRIPRRSQRYFVPGDRFFVVFLAFLAAFPPITTDMFLPALPAMGESFGASDDVISYTVSAFLLVFALSMLVWGPLSDRYGRKPVLWTGCTIFTGSSAAIAMTNSLEALLAWRCLEAVGSGAACAMALAMVKDIFRGRLMEKVVSLMQASTIIAPMAAPVLGGAILTFTSWRGVFWSLTACGMFAMGGLLLTNETHRPSGPPPSPAGFMRSLAQVLTHGAFIQPLLIFSALAMPFFSYLALCSFIYQNEFGLSPQTFSVFFAVNAAFSLAGPLLHLKWLRKRNRTRVLAWHMGIICCFGCLLMLWGNAGPYVFALLFLPITICGSALRPPSTVLMLQAVPSHAGTVSSLINSSGLFCGSLAMFCATLPFWHSPTVAVGAVAAGCGALALRAWLWVGPRLTPGAPKSL